MKVGVTDLTALCTVIILSAMIATGCHPKVAVTTPLKVEPIKVTVEKPELWCPMEDPPVPPEEISLLMDEDDVVRRVFVHVRQYNEAITWMHAMTAWMADLKQCVDSGQ